MAEEGFLWRLRSGKSVNCIYRRGHQSGLISAWAHGNGSALTWEERRDCDQYNEHAYTRDKRHEFAAVETVLAFVERNGSSATDFAP